MRGCIFFGLRVFASGSFGGGGGGGGGGAALWPSGSMVPLGTGARTPAHTTHTPHTHITRTRRTTTNAASPCFFLCSCLVCFGFVLSLRPLALSLLSFSDVASFIIFGVCCSPLPRSCAWLLLFGLRVFASGSFGGGGGGGGGGGCAQSSSGSMVPPGTGAPTPAHTPHTHHTHTRLAHAEQRPTPHRRASFFIFVLCVVVSFYGPPPSVLLSLTCFSSSILAPCLLSGCAGVCGANLPAPAAPVFVHCDHRATG